jgi:hypothetical protein
MSQVNLVFRILSYYMNYSKYLRDQYKPRMVWERSISGYVAVLFHLIFGMKQIKFKKMKYTTHQ